MCMLLELSKKNNNKNEWEITGVFVSITITNTDVIREMKGITLPYRYITFTLCNQVVNLAYNWGLPQK